MAGESEAGRVVASVLAEWPVWDGHNDLLWQARVQAGCDWDRLDIAAGTAVRFEPGQTREVQLVALAGKKTIYGFRGEVMGKL